MTRIPSPKDPCSVTSSQECGPGSREPPSREEKERPQPPNLVIEDRMGLQEGKGRVIADNSCLLSLGRAVIRADLSGLLSDSFQ